MKIVRIDITTDTGGAGSSFTSIGGGGSLYAIQMVDGTFADGVDLAVTVEQGDLSIPVFTKANFNTDSIAYPRALTQHASDGADSTLVGDGTILYCEPLVFGRIKAAVTSGGAVASGSVILYIREL